MQLFHQWNLHHLTENQGQLLLHTVLRPNSKIKIFFYYKYFHYRCKKLFFFSWRKKNSKQNINFHCINDTKKEPGLCKYLTEHRDS